ncbi:MAG: hypothetical protein ACLVAH_03800 [Anaeromassilibacillus sp.]
MNSLKSLYFDAAEPDSQRWKMLVEKHAKRAQTFEIHCWKEEPEWIDLALQYGIPKETDWPYGTVISGPVTPEFLHMLLCLPKPMDTEIYNKMTPFFSIFFDNGFSSEHYGTELHYGEPHPL